MDLCYRCEIELKGDRVTEEHIILNACGGRLKSKKLLCRACNSAFGEKFDSALAKQTNDLANLLLIKRHNGEPQPIVGKNSDTGESQLILFGGQPALSKPTIKERIEGGKVILSITARDEKELRRILKGMKKKYPEIDIESFVKSADFHKEYSDTPIVIDSSVGGADSFKSILKTSINYFIYKGGERDFIKHLLPHLEDKSGLKSVWMHYPAVSLYTPDNNEVSHVIRLVGDPNKGVLYTYIELFNAHNYIVLLNSNYEGDYMNDTYIFDLISLKEIEAEIPLDYSKDQLIAFVEGKQGADTERFKHKLSRTLTVANKLQEDKHWNDLLHNAFVDTLHKHPEGQPITQELIKKIAKAVAKEFTPLIVRNNRRKTQSDANDTEA